MSYEIHDSIGFLLVQVARNHRTRVGALLEGIHLYPGQEILVKALQREDGQAQSSLAERLGVEMPTVTKMLTRLESNGVVERRRDPEDGRVSRVYLTEQGRALATRVDGCWETVETAMLNGLSLEERLLLRRLLVQMRANME